MIFIVLIIALRAYLLLLWGRLIFEWIRVINPRFTPPGILLYVAELIYTLTDKPLQLARKILPPIRIGQLGLDLGLPAVMIVCWILIQVFAFLAAGL